MTLTLTFGSAAVVAHNVGSIAGLKAQDVSGLATGELRYVRGRATDNDGGQGIFEYVSTDSSTDDTGTIIAPTVGSGRWLRHFSGALNVKWFATIADAITACATRTAASKSTQLYFPSQSSAYDLTGVVIPEFVMLIGDGYHSKLGGYPKFEHLVEHQKWPGGAQNVHFTDGMFLSRCRNASFTHCQFGAPVRLDASYFNHYNTFLHCLFMGSDGILVEGQSHFNKVISCRFTHSNYGVRIQTGAGIAPADSWSFIGNSFETADGASAQAGLDLAGHNHVAVGNYFESNSNGWSAGGAIVVRGRGSYINLSGISGDGSYSDLGTDTVTVGTFYNAAQSDFRSTQKWKTENVSPNGSGDVTINHGCYKTPRAVICTINSGTTAYHVQMKSATADEFVATIFDMAGAKVTAGTLSMSWTAIT